VLSKDWEFARIGKDNLRGFDSILNDDKTEIIIANCRASKNDISFLKIPKSVTKIRCNNVLFIGDYADFSRFGDLENLYFSRCVFSDRVRIDVSFSNVDITHSIFEKECILGIEKKISAFGVKFNELRVFSKSNFACFDLIGVWCTQLFVKRNYNTNEIKNKGLQEASNFYFKGLLQDEAIFHTGVEFSSIHLLLEGFEEKFQIGKIIVRASHALNNLLVKAEDDRVTFFCDYLEIDFDYCKPKNIWLNSTNFLELWLKGKNHNTLTIINKCKLNTLKLYQYYQLESASLTINELTCFYKNSGELIVEDSIFQNNYFYFQNCNLKNWKMSFPGSKFLYQSLSSVLPEYTSEKLSVDEKLNAYNTILNNTRKEDDVINWSELKKQQWLVLWEKRKGNITAAQWLQKITQWTNDYGTKWHRAFGLFLLFNLVMSIFIMFCNDNLIHCCCEPCQSTPYLLNQLGEVFVTCIYPLSKPDFAFWVLNLVLVVLVKTVNAVLIVQIVSAFRGYFKGR